MFYKVIEKLIKEDDMDYKNMPRQFGYKCQLMRDPEHIEFLYEVFVPTEMSKGLLKIKAFEDKMGIKDALHSVRSDGSRKEIMEVLHADGFRIKKI